VPEVVRLRVLELCRDRLAHQGVAYISFNALPGGHIRRMLRDMMLFHTRPHGAPTQRIGQAKELMRLLVAGQTRDDEFAAVLKKEAQRILQRGADAFLFHDDLADFNQPYYFQEFAALAAQHGLQYLAEADFFEMQDWTQPPAVIEALKVFADDIILKEQYLDFIKCRRFRQTLLCRQDVSLKRQLEPALVRKFLIASPARPKAAGPVNGTVEEIIGPRGASMQIDHPLAQAAVQELRVAWPRALPWSDLLKAARARLGRPALDDFDGEAVRLADFVLAGYSAELVELHVFQPDWAALPGPRPVLSPLARGQLAQGRQIVAGLRHTGSRMDAPVVREMLLLLDGTRDVQTVAAELGRRIDAGTLALPAGASHASLLEDVEKAVRDAAAGALLIA
jgi:hypothetical protein